MKEDHKGNGQDYNGQEVPIDETIGRSLGNESLDEDLCTLGAGAEPEGYSLSYSLSLKKFFCFNLRKKRCSEASCFHVSRVSEISS